MATELDRKEFEKRTSILIQPPKPFPKIPEAVKENPKYRAAWEEFDRQVAEWVKSGGRQ